MTNGEALKKMQAIKAYMTSGNPIWSVTEIGEAFDMAIEALDRTEPQWIPCSERLPRSQEEVIVSIGDASGDSLFSYTTTGWLTPEGKLWIVDNEISNYVIAWMPLPEPWEGENHEL